MKDLWTHIRELSELDGISGREDAVREYLLGEIGRADAETAVMVDPMGNLLVAVTGARRAAKKAVFAAHMDEVGLIVTGIDEDGLIRFDTVGGIVNAVLFGCRVRLGGRVGVIAGKAIHQCKGDEQETAPKPEALRIDIGAKDRAEAEQFVRPGSRAAFDIAFGDLGTACVCGKALDDRAGCALLLELLREEPPYDLTLAFTVQEEVGLRGATGAAFRLQPDIAVVVESTTAADVAGSTEATEVCRQGAGAVLSFMDRRTLYPRELADRIEAAAAENGIAVQQKTRVAGGNDAGAFQTAGGGCAVAAVSLACRYLHSPVCVLNRADVEQTAALIRLLPQVLLS